MSTMSPWSIVWRVAFYLGYGCLLGELTMRILPPSTTPLHAFLVALPIAVLSVFGLDTLDQRYLRKPARRVPEKTHRETQP